MAFFDYINPKTGVVSVMAAAVKALLIGEPADSPLPQKIPVAPPPMEARTAVLRTLMLYLSEVTFYRSQGDGRTPLAERIPFQNMFTEWPEAVEDLAFPAIGVNPGEANYAPCGLAPVVMEDTVDQFGKGTVLSRLWYVRETLQLELWAASGAQRAGLVQGLEQVLQSSQDRGNLRLLLPDYYNTTAAYALLSINRVDDADAMRNRRRALVRLEVHYEVVRLSRYNDLTPTLYSEIRASDETA